VDAGDCSIHADRLDTKKALAKVVVLNKINCQQHNSSVLSE
jgi:hypothetical protein